MTINWWTLGIQTVNVAVLVWLLGRFFWRPVAAMIEQRRVTTQRALAEAEALRTQAATALAEIERTRAGFGQEREAILAAARAAAEQARTARLQEAATDVAALETAAKEAAEKGQLAADAAWAERASRLAVEIAGRLLARLDGVAVRAAFMDWLIAEIRRLPDPARQAVAAEGGRTRSGQFDGDRPGRPGSRTDADRRRVRRPSADRLHGRPGADRRPGAARPQLHREQ